MPAARHQSTENCRLRQFSVEVKRLRVELSGESIDLLLVERVRSGNETLPDRNILKINECSRI
jgi:hypothetical protein